MKFIEGVIYYDDMIPGSPCYNFAKKIIQVILKDGQIDLFDYYEIINDSTVTDRMLATNVFSFNSNSFTITFKSKLVENYILVNINKN